METPIDEMLKAWESLDIEQAAIEIIENTAEYPISLVQRQLYTESIDGDGDLLKPYRNSFYADFKSRLNPGLGGMTDLYLTGAWYKGMFLEIKGEVFSIRSHDSKDAKLRGQYGPAIEVLTVDSEAQYANNIVNPALGNYIRRVTGAI